MNTTSTVQLGLALALLIVCSDATNISGAIQTVHQDNFEMASGFDPAFELSGQGGWTSEGSGGNGILDGAFSTGGQQAYIGFYPPTQQTDQFTATWVPINYEPLVQNKPLVIFTTDILIRDSDTGGRDDFRWTIYNKDVQHLFTLAFDNSTFNVCYALNDGNELQPTSWSFVNEEIYSLTISMDFENNLWSAYLGSTEVVSGKQISTNESALTLGDINAGWFILDTNNPGNNFMLFDNYTITAMERPAPEPAINILSRSSSESLVRITGTPGKDYTLQYSTDLKNWITLGNWLSPTGQLDVTDPVETSPMFYRALETSNASPLE